MEVAIPSPIRVRCNPGSSIKFCPTVAEIAEISPICSIIVAIAIGAITRIAVKSNFINWNFGIPTHEADAIDVNLIYQYTKSQLFEELRQAKEVHKEQPFYINIPAKDVVSEAENSKKNILVQGIIDLYYIDKNDNLVLIDFKTDYISNEPNAKEKILEKYKVQLEIYKTALEQALGRKVNKTAICLVKDEYYLEIL